MVCRRLNMVLAKLPGTDSAYQPGDECPAGHFLPGFQGAAEIRGELVGAGVIARELSWTTGVDVVADPPHSQEISLVS